MRQYHDPDCERTEAKLVRHEDFTSTTDRTPPMTDAELGSHHEDVVILLLVAELLEHRRRLGGLAQTLFVDLTVTVVVELAVPRLLDRIKHLLHCFAVGRCDRLPLRDGEPSFGVGRNRTFRELLEGVPDTREDLGENLRLLRDSLGFRVPREVPVLRVDLLVLELVGDRQVLERGEGGRAYGLGEFVAVLDDALGARIVETELTENLLDGIGSKPVDLFDLAGRCCLLSNRVHLRYLLLPPLNETSPPFLKSSSKSLPVRSFSEGGLVSLSDPLQRTLTGFSIANNSYFVNTSLPFSVIATVCSK